jgi:homogentisate 1,2-dioxygenase
MHHGPHPKALRNQNLKTHTDEYAVMLDALSRLEISPSGKEVEWQEYWMSWMENSES